jgi:hypothetical protein
MTSRRSITALRRTLQWITSRVKPNGKDTGRLTSALSRRNSLLQIVPPRATNRRMDRVIRKYASLDAMKADEYRAWQRLAAHERMDAVAGITLAAYQMKGSAPDVRRLRRTLVHLQRPER